MFYLLFIFQQKKNYLGRQESVAKSPKHFLKIHSSPIIIWKINHMVVHHFFKPNKWVPFFGTIENIIENCIDTEEKRKSIEKFTEIMKL